MPANKPNNKEPDISTNHRNYFYSQTLKEHFFNPKNFVKGDKPDFDFNGVGKVGSPACGDIMRMWVKVDPKTERIKKCAWKTFGCASAIAATSVLSEMVKGVTVDEALKITPQQISAKLGGLPGIKVHCSVLGDKALEEAINDYFQKTNQFDRITNKDQTYIDPEVKVTQKDIKQAVKEGVTDFEKLREKTKLGSGDPKIIPKAKRVFEHYVDKYSSK